MLCTLSARMSSTGDPGLGILPIHIHPSLPSSPHPTDLPGLPGVWAAVRYLVSLTEDEAALIRNHSGWILGADPEAGLQVWIGVDPRGGP